MQWKDLTTSVRIELARGFRGDAAPPVVGPLHSGPYSQIFRIDLPQPLAAKLCRDPRTGDPHTVLARGQFEQLSRVYSAMGEAKPYRVPRPVLLDESAALVVMEWAPGRRLSDLLQGRTGASAAVEAVFHAGAWLRHFHDSGPHSIAPFEAGRHLAALDELVASRAPALRGSALLRRARRALARTAPVLEGARVQRSWVHGDYQLDNVLVGSRRKRTRVGAGAAPLPAMIGLDIAFAREDTALLDAATFLNSLETFLLLPKAWRRLGRRRRLVAAFRAGYGLVDAAVLDWLRILYLMRIVCVFHAAGPTRLHDGYFLASVRILLNRLTLRLVPLASARPIEPHAGGARSANP